jgi:hypothetical protein
MVAIGLGRTVSDHFGLTSSLKRARMLLREKGRIDNEVIAALDNDVMKRFAFCGTSEQLRKYVKELDAIGFTKVVFGPPIGMSRNGVENLVSTKMGS